MSVTTIGQLGSPDRRASEERALFDRLATDGDTGARDALVERFLPLARSLAMRYQRSSEPLDDLLQVASLGLIKAVDRFDVGRGGAFAAYAVPTILGELKRHFRDRTWAVRVPRGLQELSLRVDRAVGELTEQRGRQPSIAQIAAAVDAGEEEVLEALRAGGAYRTISLDAAYTAGGDAEGDTPTLADTIGADDDGFDRAEERATLHTLMPAMTPRELSVLHMRFTKDMTQSEIAAVIGVGQMQVSRIIRQALERLRLAGQDDAALAAA